MLRELPAPESGPGVSYFFLSKIPAIILERLGGACDVDVSSLALKQTPLQRLFPGRVRYNTPQAGCANQRLAVKPKHYRDELPDSCRSTYGELLTKVGNRVGCDCNIMDPSSHVILVPAVFIGNPAQSSGSCLFNRNIARVSPVRSSEGCGIISSSSCVSLPCS